MMELPLPAVKATATFLITTLVFDLSVMVIVDSETPSATTVVGDATTVDFDALTAAAHAGEAKQTATSARIITPRMRFILSMLGPIKFPSTLVSQSGCVAALTAPPPEILHHAVFISLIHISEPTRLGM